MNEDLISLNTTPPDETETIGEPISLDPKKFQPMTPEVAQARAQKVEFSQALPELTREEIYNNFIQGEEQRLRELAAARRDAIKHQTRQDRIEKLSRIKGGITPEEVRTIIDNPPKPSAPDTVLEQEYAEQYNKYFGQPYTNTPNWNWPDTVYGEALTEIPGLTEKARELSSTLVAQREFLLKLYQNILGSREQQSWPAFLLDMGKIFVPGYSQIKQRGLTPETSFWYGLLGTNLEAQAKDYFRLPLDQFKDSVYAVVDKLRGDNPTLALMYLKDMMGQSASDAFLNDLFGVADITALPGIARTVVKGGKTVHDFWRMNKTIRTAFEDIAKSAADVNVDPKIAVPKAAGDTGEAAVQTLAKDIAAANGGPVVATPSNVAEDLFAYMRAQADVIETAKGRSSRELITRLRAAYNQTIARVNWAINEMVRVERVPEMQAREAGARAVKESLRNEFRGPKDMILDFAGPFRKPMANVDYGYVYLGQPTGEIFPTERTARLTANHLGFPTAEIEKVTQKGPGKLTPTKDWQPVSKDAVLPPGLEIRMDLAAGKTFVRIPPGSKEKFSPISIEQEGFGYRIKIEQPIRETSDPIRSLLNTTPKTEPPQSLVKGWLSYFRTGEDTLANEHNAMRKAAQFGATVLMKILKEEAKYISDLSKGLIRFDPVTGERLGFLRNRFQKWWSQANRSNAKRWAQWEETLNFAQDAIDPVTKQKGYFFRTPLEIEDHYARHYRRLPEPAEIDAYFAVVRRVELDAIVRVLAEYRNIHREGGRYFRVSYGEIDSKTYSDWVVGTPIKNLPSDEATIWLQGPALGRLYNKGKIETKFRKDLIQAMKEGSLSGFRIHYPDRAPLKGFNKSIKEDDWIQYVIAPSVEEKPLDWNLLPRRGGGHMDFDYAWYQKQGSVVYDRTTNSYIYKGDTTAQPFNNRAKGEKLNEHWNNARKLIAEGKLAEAKAYVEKNLPHPWEEFHGWFKPTKIKGETVPPRFNAKMPFRIVPKDKMIADLDKTLERQFTDKGSKFKDGTKEWNPARQFNVQYTGQRDAWEVFTTKDVGTRSKPVYEVVDAEKIPVLPSLDRALGRMIHSLFFDDYKMHAIEHWIKEAASHLKAVDAELKAQPYYHFSSSGRVEAFKSATPIEVRDQLIANWKKIHNFIGVPSKFETTMMSSAQRLADTMYNTLGSAEGRSKLSPVRAFIVTPPAALEKLSDPWQFLRSLAFYPMMGFWAIPQIFVQSQTFAAIYAIAGMRYANAGTFATLLHQYSRLPFKDKAVLIDKLDEIASKFKTSVLTGVRWRPGEFKESLGQLEKTGWGNVGGEYAALDSPWMGQHVVEHMGSRFLDASLFFFRGAERNVKFAAWHTAFKEFRDKFPTKTITNHDLTGIMQRADLLNQNMSRASSSPLHTGFMSFFGQFLAYQLRTAELFWGKRFADTTKERAIIRARIVAWYAALYGLPVAGASSGLPIADLWRKRAIEHDYIVGEKDWETLVYEGMPAYLIALATGGGDIKKGKFYNIPSRYGPSGYTPVLDFLKGDKTWYEMASGASGSVMKGIYDGFSGLGSAFLAASRGEPSAFEPKLHDVIDAAKWINSINGTYRTIVAANTGKWISKKDITLTGVGGWEAVLLGVTGLQPTEVSDLHLKAWLLKDEQELWKKIGDQFTKELRKGLEVASKSPEEAHSYYRRAFSLLIPSGYPEERIPSLIARATRDYENLVEEIDRRFYSPMRGERRVKAFQIQQGIRMNK